jgi:CRISPR type IV-associated DEAD/DEAH-box helicase Csf4
MPGSTPAVRAALTPPKRPRVDVTADEAALDQAHQLHQLHQMDAHDDVSRLNKQQWWQSVAAVIAHRVRATAAGGTLVLCASYEDAYGLADALAVADVPDDDLISPAPETPLLELRDRFLARARGGTRPVWCATGAAWTGLDCRDAQAAGPGDDRGLTDLVIPRIPWSLNRSLVHAARCRRNFVKYETADTALRLRQGLGRLVRQPGLRDRRVWMLDARCWNPEDARQRRLYAPMREVLAVYGHKLVLASMPPTTLAVSVTRTEQESRA